MAHKDDIKAKMVALQNLDVNAQTRITLSLLNNAAKRIKETISTIDYLAYVALFGTLVTTKELHDMTDSEIMGFDLETAEAFFGLYYLSISLKQLQDNNFSLSQARNSAGGVNFNGVNEIIDSREIYLESAMKIVKQYSGSTGGSQWVAI